MCPGLTWSQQWSCGQENSPETHGPNHAPGHGQFLGSGSSIVVVPAGVVAVGMVGGAVGTVGIVGGAVGAVGIVAGVVVTVATVAGVVVTKLSMHWICSKYVPSD